MFDVDVNVDIDVSYIKSRADGCVERLIDVR